MCFKSSLFLIFKKSPTVMVDLTVSLNLYYRHIRCESVCSVAGAEGLERMGKQMLPWHDHVLHWSGAAPAEYQSFWLVLF